jgi:hypothetical protein
MRSRAKVQTAARIDSRRRLFPPSLSPFRDFALFRPQAPFRDLALFRDVAPFRDFAPF